MTFRDGTYIPTGTDLRLVHVLYRYDEASQEWCYCDHAASYVGARAICDRRRGRSPEARYAISLQREIGPSRVSHLTHQVWPKEK